MRRKAFQKRRNGEPLNYQDYLQLDTLLSCQAPKSREAGAELEAHDEHLFIIIHQAYELWFKQVLHEVTSIQDIFRRDYIEEKFVGLAVARLHRVAEIMKILNQQLNVLETMTPLEFLDFRDFLFPASGFQSVQFRMVENALGLREGDRLNYGQRGYCTYLREKDVDRVQDATKESLFDLVERWLERTPFLKIGSFDFWEHYKEVVKEMLEGDREGVRANTAISAEAREAQIKEIDGMWRHFESVLNKDMHDAMRAKGDRRLSFKATQAALLITLYQDEPMLHMPHRLLQELQDVDELITLWRYRHALMVHRMLGVKIGTGGSSGYHYLRSTASRHKIFTDFCNLSTFLVPKANLAPLPDDVSSMLRFTTEATGSPGSVRYAPATPDTAEVVTVMSVTPPKPPLSGAGTGSGGGAEAAAATSAHAREDAVTRTPEAKCPYPHAGR